MVIDVNEEDALIMSLVENIARKNYQPFELFKSVKRLYDEGYSAADIAAKIGLAREYMYQIIKLLENGEERLLNAVEMNKIPLNVAIQIIETPESEIQNVLQDAYEQNLIKGNKIPQIQKLLEIRKRDGKYMRVQKTPKKMSPADLHKIYEQEIERKRLLIRKAEKVENALIILTESFKKLLHNENFINLLKAENLERVPEFILEKVNQNV